MPVQTKLHDFFSRYPARMYKKGEMLIAADTLPRAFYITDGIVAQCDISDSGNKQILNMYKKGAFIPIASIVNELPTQFFFEAHNTVTVRMAPAADVREFLDTEPSVVLDALKRMSRGSEGLLARLAATMDSNAEQRILQELTIMKDRNLGKGAQLHITATALAAQTGLARETVNRALKRLHTKGTLTAARGRITLH